MSKLLVGTVQAMEEGALWQVAFDEASGQIQPPHLVAQLPGAYYMALHPEGHLLYMTGASQQEAPSLTAWALGSLGEAPIARQHAQGTHLCHLTLDSTARYLFTADYLGGMIESWGLGETGLPITPLCQLSRKGVRPLAPQQNSPHPHCVTLSPEGNALWVCDLGTDSLACYKVNPDTGFLTQETALDLPLPPGSGPRHMIFAKDGQNAYLLSELSRELFHLHYDPTSGFSIRQRLALPETNPAPSREVGGAALRLTEDGRFLYASNRGDDSLVCVSLLPGGGFGAVQRFAAGGAHPRDFILCAKDRYLACVCRHDGRLTLFARNPKDGHLSRRDTLEGLGAPVCVLELPD